MILTPTAPPFPVASGGLPGGGRAANLNMARPMRNGPPAMTRPLPQAITTPPAVQAVSGGLDSAEVRGVGQDADNASFRIVVRNGAAPLGVGASGAISVALQNNLVAVANFTAMAGWASIVKSGNMTLLTLTWTVTDPVPARGIVAIDVQWSTAT